LRLLPPFRRHAGAAILRKHMTEAQLNEYCRAKALFAEQVRSWKDASLAGFQTGDAQDQVLKQKSKN